MEKMLGVFEQGAEKMGGKFLLVKCSLRRQYSEILLPIFKLFTQIITKSYQPNSKPDILKANGMHVCGCFRTTFKPS